MKFMPPSMARLAKRKVTVDESILAAFASDLQARQSRNVRPFAGFDHKAGPASFIPKEFRYESGVGLVLDIEWTQAGKSARRRQGLLLLLAKTFYSLTARQQVCRHMARSAH